MRSHIKMVINTDGRKKNHERKKKRNNKTIRNQGNGPGYNNRSAGGHYLCADLHGRHKRRNNNHYSNNGRNSNNNFTYRHHQQVEPQNVFEK